MRRNRVIQKDSNGIRKRIETNPPSHWAFKYSGKVFKKLGTISWKGVEVKCPANIEEYIVERYGTDWETPRYLYEGHPDHLGDLQNNPGIVLSWTEDTLK